MEKEKEKETDHHTCETRCGHLEGESSKIMNDPPRETHQNDDEEKVVGMGKRQVKEKVHKLDSMPVDEFPLFMQRLPNKAGENMALEALQALLYEGTPEEIAANFRQQGNECYSQGPKGFQDALKFYTQGIQTGCKDDKLNATLHLNRSAVNLALQNWRDSIRDAQKSLEYDFEGSAIKAYRRIAKAALRVGRAKDARQALDYLAGRMGGQREDAELEGLQKELDRLESSLEEAEREKGRIREEKKQIEIMVADKKIQVVEGAENDLIGHFAQRVDLKSLPRVHLDPMTGRRLWPVLLLYPAHAQSDLIEAVDEEETIADLLSLVFTQPPPWDQDERKYSNPSRLRVFWNRTDNDTLVEIERKHQLTQLLGTLIKRIERGVLPLYVIPEGPDVEIIAARFSRRELF